MDGLDGQAIDLLDSHAPVLARELLEHLVERVRAPLSKRSGDYDMAQGRNWPGSPEQGQRARCDQRRALAADGTT